MTSPTPEKSAIPQSVWTGTFRLVGVDIVCHVLSDGQRIIEAESFENFVRAMTEEQPADAMPDIDATELARFARFRSGLPFQSLTEAHS